MSEDRDIKTDEVRELPRDEKWPRRSRQYREHPQRAPRAERAAVRRRCSQGDVGKSRRNFLVGGAAALIGIFGWRWMSDETKYKLLRGTFEFNEWVSQNLYSSKATCS